MKKEVNKFDFNTFFEDKNNDIACYELKDNEGVFLFPLKVALKCLKVAIDDYMLPPLEVDWWLDVQSEYAEKGEKCSAGNNFNLDNIQIEYVLCECCSEEFGFWVERKDDMLWFGFSKILEILCHSIDKGVIKDFPANWKFAVYDAYTRE